MRVRVFAAADETAVIDLWRRCDLVRPSNDPAADIATKLADSPDLFLVAEEDGAVVGTVMAGFDGHRGWINYLAVDGAVRRRGVGRALLDAAEAALARRGCPKVNLQVRSANVGARAFYDRVGYRVDDVVSYGKRLDR